MPVKREALGKEVRTFDGVPQPISLIVVPAAERLWERSASFFGIIFCLSQIMIYFSTVNGETPRAAHLHRAVDQPSSIKANPP
jgi:hypothetical protein